MKRLHWGTFFAAASAVVIACGSNGPGGDAGVDGSGGDGGVSDGGGSEGGNDGASDSGSTCTTTLCVHGAQPSQCPSCAPSDGDTCSPPAAVTCNYTNGCSGAQLESRQCTCVLPDASAGDGGSSGKAIWSCQSGA